LRPPAFELRALALADGDEVRWHDPGRTTWSTGRVTGIGSDGSVSVIESKGKQRALRPEALQVLRRRRSRLAWRPVITDHIQLPLFAEPARPPRPRVAARSAPPATSAPTRPAGK
jgi:hypothetical protein